MSKVLVTVFDSKAKVFNIPACFESFDDARRSFFDLCGDRNTLLGRHPEDFILYALADFDVCSGVLRVVERVPICDGTEYLLANKGDEKNA